MRGAIVIGGWSVISLVFAVAALVYFIDAQAGSYIGFSALIGVGFFVSILGQLGPAPAEVTLPLHALYRAARFGTGEVVLEADGTMRISPVSRHSRESGSAAPGPFRLGLGPLRFTVCLVVIVIVPLAAMAAMVSIAGLDVAVVTAVGLLVATLSTLATVSWMNRVSRTSSLEALVLPLDRLVAVIPYRRMFLGPSLVIGYRTDGADALAWDELLLSDAGALWRLPNATGDPMEWGSAFAELRDSASVSIEVQRHQAWVRSRESLGLWLAALGLGVLLLAAVYGTVALVTGASAIWLVIVGGVTVCLAAAITVLELPSIR